MSVWSYLGLAEERRVVVYSLVQTAANPEVIPIGTVPAPPILHENQVRNNHRPHDGQMLKSRIYGHDIVVLWANDRTEAVCFLSRTEAENYPGFDRLTRQELAGALDHFSNADAPTGARQSEVIRPVHWTEAKQRRSQRYQS